MAVVILNRKWRSATGEILGSGVLKTEWISRQRGIPFRAFTPPQNHTPERAAVIWGDKINEENGRPLFRNEIFTSVAVLLRTGYVYKVNDLIYFLYSL